MTVIDEMRNEACNEARNQTGHQTCNQAQPLDEPAWDEPRRAFTFGKERARLLALAARVLGSRAEAEDVVQDAWFRWRDADAAAVRTPQAWLATVTVHLAIDRLRKLRRESDAADELAADPSWLDGCAPSAEETGLRAAQLSEALLMLLDRLGPLEQAVFVLREAFECDYAEIAVLTGCTPAHCRQIVHRAYGRLARKSPLQAVPQPAPADAGHHARTLERLREVLHAQDRSGLMDLLGASVSVTRLPRALRAETIDLKGEPGAAPAAEDGELRDWLHVRERDDNERPTPVTCVWASEDGESANRGFDGTAVRAMLARFSARDTAQNSGCFAVLA